MIFTEKAAERSSSIEKGGNRRGSLEMKEKRLIRGDSLFDELDLNSSFDCLDSEDVLLSPNYRGCESGSAWRKDLANAENGDTQLLREVAFATH